MTLGVRGKAMLLAAAPLAATVAFLGLSVAPASAWVVQASCKGSGWTCVYANADYTPTSNILNLNGALNAWGDAPSNPCSGNWGDCASSIYNHSSNATFYFWPDNGCSGTTSPLTITHGTGYPNLQLNPSGGGWNDQISSNNMNSKARC